MRRHILGPGLWGWGIRKDKETEKLLTKHWQDPKENENFKHLTAL